MTGTVLTAALIMTSLAGVFAIILAISYKYLKVEEDPRMDLLEEMLPGTNCGACGTPGCRAFGESLITGESVPAMCTVSSPDQLSTIARFLGVDAGSVEKKVARLHCAGARGFVEERALYQGMRGCRAAHLVNGGGRACVWGCLGLGDCETACDFNAIHMSSDGLPVVDTDRCTACNDCVDVCPMDLFSLQPLSQKLVVQCSNPLAGDGARDLCSVACDACGKCVLDSAPGSMEMSGGLPQVLNPDQTTRAATFRCPTGAIAWIEENQFETVAQMERREHVGTNAS